MSQPAPAMSVPTETRAPHKRKLRNYLLNRHYQLRYTLVIVAISATLSSVMGWVAFHFVREASRVVYTSMLQDAPAVADELKVQMGRHDHLLLLAFFVFGIMLCIVLFGLGIIITHKVAGPLFKVSAYMHRITEGHIGPPPLNDLRKGDDLVDFYDAFRHMHEALVQQSKAEIDELERAATDAEHAGAKGVADSLRSLKKKKEESLT